MRSHVFHESVAVIALKCFLFVHLFIYLFIYLFHTNSFHMVVQGFVMVVNITRKYADIYR